MSPSRPEFKKQLRILTVGLMVGLPLFYLYLGIRAYLESRSLIGDPFPWVLAAIPITPIWGVPAGFGVYFHRKILRQFLDARLRIYRVGGRKGRIQDIHALQIVAERTEALILSEDRATRTENRPWWSHELNLVLEDRKRVNLMVHGDLDGLRSDALRLSEFLGPPIWDSTIPSSDREEAEEEAEGSGPQSSGCP
jgi:hypothetical protein